ncbi:MAG: thioredoxin family protein [Polyangia bacterium]
MANTRYPGGRLAALGAVVMVALLSSVGARAEIKFTSPTPTFDEALQRAQKQGKPLVLEFSASWCGPCKQMARALERPELQEALGRVHWLVIDGSDDPLGSQLMQAVMAGERLAFPTTIAFDSDGKEVMRYSGFSNTRALETWIRSLPERAIPVAELRKSADAAPKDGALQRRVADRLLKAGDRAGARQYLLKAEQAGPPEVAAKAAWQRLRLDYTDRSEQSDSQLGQQLLLPVAAKYPTGEQALAAARYLALVSKPQAAQVEAILLKWAAAKQSASDLREAAHVALKAGAGANRAAIEIGKKLAEQPKPDAERQDTLAEIAFLAENNVDKAVDLAQKAMAGASEARKQALSANIERYRRNQHEPAERPGFEAPKLALPNKKKPSSSSPPSAEAQLLARGKRELVRSVQKDCWQLLGSAAAIEVGILSGETPEAHQLIARPGTSGAWLGCAAERLHATPLPPRKLFVLSIEPGPLTWEDELLGAHEQAEDLCQKAAGERRSIEILLSGAAGSAPVVSTALAAAEGKDPRADLELRACLDRAYSSLKLPMPLLVRRVLRFTRPGEAQKPPALDDDEQ